MPEAEYRPYETEMEAAEAVVGGEVDAFVYDRPFNATFLALRGDDDVVFLDEPFTEEAIAFAIRKGDPEFLSWLNDFLAEIRADGRYEHIRAKWFDETGWFDRYR